jgi:hypothetical protein
MDPMLPADLLRYIPPLEMKQQNHGVLARYKQEYLARLKQDSTLETPDYSSWLPQVGQIPMEVELPPMGGLALPVYYHPLVLRNLQKTSQSYPPLPTSQLGALALPQVYMPRKLG